MPGLCAGIQGLRDDLKAIRSPTHITKELLQNMYACSHPGVIYNATKKAWECFDCGETMGTQSGEIWEKRWSHNPPSQSGPKCECGSEKVGSDRHSGYCPKYIKDTK